VNPREVIKPLYRRSWLVGAVIAAPLLAMLYKILTGTAPIHQDDHSRDLEMVGYGVRIVFEIEDYMKLHNGQVPKSVNSVFEYSRVRFQQDRRFVPNPIFSYPKNPYGTTQAIDILAPEPKSSSEPCGSGGTDLGKGEYHPPSQLNHFGAISYRVLGSNRKHYLFCVTGRRGDRAACVYCVSD